MSDDSSLKQTLDAMSRPRGESLEEAFREKAREESKTGTRAEVVRKILLHAMRQPIDLAIPAKDAIELAYDAGVDAQSAEIGKLNAKIEELTREAYSFAAHIAKRFAEASEDGPGVTVALAICAELKRRALLSDPQTPVRLKEFNADEMRRQRKLAGYTLCSCGTEWIGDAPCPKCSQRPAEPVTCKTCGRAVYKDSGLQTSSEASDGGWHHVMGYPNTCKKAEPAEPLDSRNGLPSIPDVD